MSDKDYYKRTKEFDPRTRANGLDVEFELDAISAAFDKIPAPREDGQGYDGPIHVGEATAPTHAVQLQQMEAQIGDNTANANRAEEAAERAEEARDIAIEKAKQSGEARDEALEAAATVTNIHREQLEKALGVNARVYPRLTNQNLKVGDVIPAPEETADGLPITHVIVDGNAVKLTKETSGEVNAIVNDAQGFPVEITINSITQSIYQSFQNTSYIDIRQFFAPAAPLDSSAHFQRAIDFCHENGIGEVRFNGNYGWGKGVKAKSLVTLVGSGVGSSEIASLPGFTGNIYETEDYANLVASGITETDQGCPISYGIESCTIDGFNFNGDVTAETGFGVRLYGRQLRLRNLIIGRTAGIGLWTEFPAIPVYPSFDAITDTKFSFISNIEILETGYEGFVFSGPTDMVLDNIFVGWPAGSRFDDFDTTGPKQSLSFPGEEIHGVRIQKTVEIGFIHSYDNDYGYAVYVDRQAGNPPVRLRAKYLMGENSFGGVYLGENVRYQVGIFETHNNVGGPSNAGAYSALAGKNPHAKIRSNLGGKVSNLDIWRDGDEKGSNGLELSGVSNWIEGNVFAYSANFSGGGKGAINSSGSSTVKVKVYSGTTNRLGVGYEESADARANDLDIYASNCDVNISLLGADYSENGTSYKLKSVNHNVTAISGINRIGYNTYRNSDIQEITPSGVKYSTFVGSQVVDLGSTSIQSVTFTHNLVRTPEEREVALTLSYDTGSIPPIRWFSTISTSPTTIIAQIQFEGGGNGSGRLNCRVG
ncbi:TPA: hypothetical protein I6Z04_000102 [Vibrio cholerae]|nr:hypothetical protein [Vibrio cholerae]